VTDSHNASHAVTTTAAVTSAAPTPTPTPPATNFANDAAFVAQSALPATLTAGARASVWVKMRNTGTVTWTAAHLYRLGVQGPQDGGQWATTRVALPADVLPGHEVTFNFHIFAPSPGDPLLDESDGGGHVNFQWRMVQDGVQWFGGYTPNVSVHVQTPPWYVAPAPGVASNHETARLEAANRVGTGGDDLLSRNFTFSLPLVGLPGRNGLDMNLALSYNSLVWTKVLSPPSFHQPNGRTSYYFDADQGFPGPGFRIGLPAIQGQFYNSIVGSNSYLLILPSGRRVELRQVAGGAFESVDSSNLKLLTGANGQLLLRSPDGTQFTYVSVNGEYRCTGVKDADGNYLTATYNTYGRVATMSDTLGRVVKFNYDTNNRLLSLTQQRGATEHAWATFGYSTINVRTNFGETASGGGGEGMLDEGIGGGPVTVYGPPNDTSLTVLTQVGMADGSRYRFDYGSWGQVRTIRRFAADNHELAYTSYDLPADDSTLHSDCPRFTERRDWVENWNNNTPAVTKFSSGADAVHGEWVGQSRPDAPDSVVYKEFYAAKWGGLLLRTESYDANHPATPRKVTSAEWTQDNPRVGYQFNPRPTKTTVTDSAGNAQHTYFNYTSFGLISDIYEADRRTHIDYNLSAAYLGRHIVGLAQSAHVFGIDPADGQQKLYSKISYGYDEANVFSTAGKGLFPTQHDSNYGSAFTARGNLTRVTRWNVNSENDAAQALSGQTGYNETGTVAFTRDPSGHQLNISYLDSFSYDGGLQGATSATPATHVDDLAASTNSTQTLAYPTYLVDADGFSATASYDFHLGALVRLQGPPPQGVAEGAIQTTSFDRAGRVRQSSVYLSSGSEAAHSPHRFTRLVYPSSQTVVNAFASVNSLTTLAYTAVVLDGAGRTRATARDLPNAPAGHYGGTYTTTDILGRASRQYRPTEMTNAWNAVGDDAAGWAYTLQSYNWQNKPTRITNADGTHRDADYTGCGCAGGELVTTTDEVGRRQRIYRDAHGRQAKTEELNADGSVYRTATSTYNPLDQITRVLVRQGTSGTGQETLVTFDGHGRVATRKEPAQSAPTAFAYNADDTVRSVTDARAVTRTLTRNNRHLVTGVTHTAPSGVAPTGPVALAFDAAGNRVSMTDDTGRVDYQRDALSQITAETRQFAGLPGSYTLGYTYNPAGELASVTDPAGVAVNYGFDHTGRLNNVTGSTYAGVSQYAGALHYRAFGALKSLTYGNNQSLTQSFDARTRLASFQLGSLMSAEFDYYADGKIRFAKDNVNPTMDRAYEYDQVGRIAAGLSGAEARGEATADGIYRQTYQWDAWDNLTGRATNRFWSGGSPFTDTFVNDRKVGGSYDAEGNPTSDGDSGRQRTYDAASRMIQTREQSQSSSWGTLHASVVDPDPPQPEGGYYNTTVLTISLSHDGDGASAKRVQKRVTSRPGFAAVTAEQTEYYVRSSVLGGQIVTELNGQGQKDKTNVYAGGDVLVEQKVYAGGVQGLVWKGRNPVTRTSVEQSTGSGQTRKNEYDPFGLELGENDPYLASAEPDYASMFGGSSYRSGGNPFDGGDGCMWDGAPVRCTAYAFAINSGYINPEDDRGFRSDERPNPFERETDGERRQGGRLNSRFDNAAEYGDAVDTWHSPLWVGMGETAGWREVMGSARFFDLSQQPAPTPDSSEVVRLMKSCLINISNIPESLYNIIRDNKTDNQSLALSLAHAAIESGFLTDAEGFQKEIGLFQIKLSTANDLGSGTFTRQQVFDPALNTRLATTHLQKLVNSFNGDVRTALGAYKQGETGVRKRGLTKASQEYADGILECERRILGR
jgi:YD repeat-containing protein